MKSENVVVVHRVPWNKGKLTGQKPPLELLEIWAIRTRLQMASNVRELSADSLREGSRVALGRLVDAFELATKCIAAWSAFVITNV
ncbi:hypothetical protein NA66_10142 [Burkholderia pyrrocinia]|uniref:Integrase n=1 Tax=Burkholderia pyrrocinia TaxID=60550 RepID=A0A318IJN8_BURPY|nr:MULTISPECIES: hypothetical protein [unclassified Burkholderia]PXX30999.1 hypothetical protein NA66_10142 [Burkholderia pyrrocinia]SFW76062.1 hypothetical protein SAMN03159384_04625 [Burkholderia sp. NFACC33-1]SFY42030.1 hypothetical protein SAMN03159408_05179 [Burkholderia sp. NFPP32]